MRIKTKIVDPVDVDPDGIAEAQAVAGAGPLTLNGALIADGIFTGDYARKISITSDGADTARTFTVTGEDPDGKAQTEDIAGPGTATTEGVKYWSIITSIVADAAAAGNISSGTLDELSTNTIPLDRINGNPATISVENLAGTLSYTVQETFTDLQFKDVFQFYDVNGLDNRFAAGLKEITNHATGVRLKFNSYTSGAYLEMVIVQDRAR